MAAIVLVAALLGVTVVASAIVPTEYVPTPAGYMHKDCVHFNIPRGSTVTRTSTGGIVTLSNGKGFTIPLCKDSRRFRTRKEAQRLGSSRQLQLPADYDGWLQYAAFHDEASPSIGSFTGNMSTPGALPASTPDQLFLFPGLQSDDWIPKVDPYPTGHEFDIIQPVLQYPADAGLSYSVKSWWVTVDMGAMASDEIVLKPGEIVRTNMTQTGKAKWFIDSQVVSTGEHTSIIAENLGARLDTQPWAYVTMECYGCTGCDTLPQHNASTLFSGMALADTTGKPIPLTWLPNPKPAKDRTCPSSIEIKDSATVAIYPGTSP